MKKKNWASSIQRDSGHWSHPLASCPLLSDSCFLKRSYLFSIAGQDWITANALLLIQFGLSMLEWVIASETTHLVSAQLLVLNKLCVVKHGCSLGNTPRDFECDLERRWMEKRSSRRSLTSNFMNEESFTTVEYLDEGIISLRLIIDRFITFLILLNTRHEIGHSCVLRNIFIIRTFQLHFLNRESRKRKCVPVKVIAEELTRTFASMISGESHIDSTKKTRKQNVCVQ